MCDSFINDPSGTPLDTSTSQDNTDPEVLEKEREHIIELQRCWD